MFDGSQGQSCPRGSGVLRAIAARAWVAGLCWLAACSPEPPDPSPASYVNELEAWHAARIEALRAPTGWLSLIGLYPLEAGARRIGSSSRADIPLPEPAPPEVGMFTVGRGRIAFAAYPSARVMVCTRDGQGHEVSEPTRGLPIATDAAGDPTILAVGTLRFYVIERGGEFFVRVKDTASELLRTFDGIERFPVSEDWKVSAQLLPAADGETVAITNALGQIQDSPTPGTLAFTLAGVPCRLIPVGSPGGRSVHRLRRCQQR